MLIDEGKLENAKRLLRPIAFAPHENEFSAIARTVIDKIDDGTISDSATFQRALAEFVEEPSDDDGTAE